MVAALNDWKGPLALAVSGEAESWLPAVEAIVGSRFLVTYRVSRDSELLEVIRERLADAAVLDEEVHWPLTALQVLRMVRRVDPLLPVVMVARQPDRRWLEDALRLEAFSVVTKPLALEELLRQIQRIMARLDQTLRNGEEF
jgi:DNA-binding NtrC family response regulator